MIMKKSIFAVICALLIGVCFISCNNKGAASGAAGAEAAEAAAEDGGSAEAKNAIEAAKEIYDYMVDLDEKNKAGKLSDADKFAALEKVFQMDADWDKLYKNLKEGDYTPAQWKELQDIKEKISTMMNVEVR